MGETDSLATLCSAHKDSPVAKTINTLTAFPFPFFWDQVFASQIETKEEIRWVKLTLLRVSSKLPISFAESTLRSANKDGPVAKTFNTLTSFPFSFFRDQVFASQIKTKKEICWVKLTALRVSSQSPISHTKSTLCSVHKDSPVAETFNTLTSFPFPLFCRTSLCITDLNQERD